MSDHPPGNRQYTLLVAIVFTVAFASGYAARALLYHGDENADEHARIMIAEAIRQGILVVDHERLAELEKLYHGD